MRIWRVAHTTGTYRGFPSGPYSTIGTSSEVMHRLNGMHRAHGNGSVNHPAPHRDQVLGDVFRNERCGFDSREALFAWFDGYTEVLHDCEFRIYVYEVPDNSVRVGKYGQALFIAYDAKPVTTESLI